MVADTAKILNKIFSDKDFDFDEVALAAYHYQYLNSTIYKKFADLLGKIPKKVQSVDEIPFLPVEFFRDHQVYTAKTRPELTFQSSGVTSEKASKHLVAFKDVYERSFLACFESFHGKPADYVFLCLLPSYLERKNSSLVYMCDALIKKSGKERSGFYLYDHQRLVKTIQEAKRAGEKVFLLGVSFALLDLSEKYSFDMKGHIIMETGGMKGRGREMIREELHEILSDRFHTDVIHSEYGMTELLSQSYSKGKGIFKCPPWMKIMIRDAKDPLSMTATAESGGVNIIDLANIYSCPFISTSDIGRKYANGSFEILGRLDNSEIRGCSLLLS